MALPGLIALTAALTLGASPAQADDLLTDPSGLETPTDPSSAEPSVPPSTEEAVIPGSDATTAPPVIGSAEDVETPAPGQSGDPSKPGAGDAAVAAGNLAEIAAPSNGATVSAGTIDYIVNVSSLGAYWLDLSCDGVFQTDRYLYASYSGQQFSGQMGDAPEGQSCSLELYPADGDATGYDYITFTTASQAPSIGNPTASPAEFYPTVRDRYRDRTEIKFGSRLDSDVTVAIRRADSGTVVRSYSLPGRATRDYHARRTVAWNGENNAGRVVAEGRYVAVITSSRNGLTSTVRVPLRVASGYRTARVTKTADGWYDSRDTTRGNCYSTEAYPRGNDLNCWGGRYAQATYRFRIPSNAYNVRWDVAGRRGCCTPGQVIKDGTRTSGSSYRVTVRVTNWAAYVVRKVTVTYTYRRAI